MSNKKNKGLHKNDKCFTVHKPWWFVLNLELWRWVNTFNLKKREKDTNFCAKIYDMSKNYTPILKCEFILNS